MPAITVNVVVIHENQILLTKREDFEVWCLPSGGVEAGESLAQAARRETREETGLEVELKSLVGVYSRIGALPDTHAALFTAVPTAGTLRPQPGETIEVRFFPFDEIPEDLSFGHGQRIQDAIRSAGSGLAVVQEMLLPDGVTISRDDIVAARKQTREMRIQFYQQTMKRATMRVVTEVGENLWDADKH